MNLKISDDVIGIEYASVLKNDAIAGVSATVESLEREGFRLVPLSQLLYEEAYHLDVKGRQIPDDR